MAQSIDLSKIVLDDNLYPRNGLDWMTVYQYTDALKAKANFPAIEVAARGDEFVIIDGAHRVEAYRKAKKRKIRATIRRRWSDAKIFATSVKVNASHGRKLSTQERVRSAQRLLSEFKFKKDEVQKILDMPISTLTRLISQRVESYTAVGVAALVTKKGPISNLDLSDVDPSKVESAQKILNSSSQISIFKQALTILKNDMLDFSNPRLLKVVDEVAKEIKKLKVKA